MKSAITGLSLLATLPATTGSLRGSTRNIVAPTIFDAAANRNLEQCVEDPYFGGSDGSAVCCMPDQIDIDFFRHDGAEEVSGTTRHRGSNEALDLDASYWHITMHTGRLAGVEMSGWCVDLSRFMSSTTYDFDMYSTYDDFPYDNVLDSPEKLANVNWMINNFRLGNSYEVPANSNDFCGDTDETIALHWQTMQNAIWRTVDKGALNGQFYQNSGSNECLLWYMVDQANALGDYYEPSCDDPDAEMAVILIHDTDENTINKQVIIGEAKLAEIPGACKPAECCEQLSIKHETFQENREISIAFSQSVSGSDSAWEVSFTDANPGDVYPTTLTGVDAWSVDLDRADAAAAGTFLVDTYSSYDNWYRYNAVDKKANIPKVNYLINEYPVGTAIASCSDAVVSVDDFQDAVWELMDNAQPDSSRGTPNACISTFLVSEANSNGSDYEPSCLEGTTDKLAILLIVDAEGDYKLKYTTGMKANDVVKLESVANQVMIAAVPISEISGACYMKDCECCDPPTFEFPVSSPTDTRNDPTVGAPVDEIGTPAPAPVRPPPPTDPVCPDPFEIMGSSFGTRCGHQGVKLLSSDTGSSGASPALRIDILDTFFGITTGSDDKSVDFSIQNPFAGGAVDMYIQYETTSGDDSGFRYAACESDPSVDECQFFGGGQGDVITAACIDPPNKLPYALVTAFFVESGNDLFSFTTTNNVPECCQPDTTNSGTVVTYTFEVMCTCPEGTDAQF